MGVTIRGRRGRAKRRGGVEEHVVEEVGPVGEEIEGRRAVVEELLFLEGRR